MRPSAVIAIAVVPALFAAGPAGVGATEPSAVLEGIEEVYVGVDYVSEIVLSSGMRDHDLQIELANRLRDGGLLVLSASSEETAGPLLVFTLESIELPTGDVALQAALELREAVELARKPGVYALGSTWYSSMLTASPRTGVADESRAVAAALADQFLADLAPAPAAP